MSRVIGGKNFAWTFTVIMVGFVIMQVFLVIPSSTFAEKSTGVILVDDILVRPGKPGMLKARLIQSGIVGKVGVGGEQVTFVIDGREIGTAMTGGDGKALLEYSTPMRGNHKIVAKVLPSSRVNPSEGEGLLASWERRRPILLIDVSVLIKQPEGKGELLPALERVFSGDMAPEPREDAVKELHNLAKYYYNLIYLFQDGNIGFEEGRSWLRTHEFPRGLTRSLYGGKKTLEGFIGELKEGGWDNIEAGIGQTPEFAKELVSQRILAVIFSESEKEDYPRRAKLVTKWGEVRQNL